MEISAVAVPFLILAAALGPPTHGAPADGFQPREFGVNEHGPVVLQDFVEGGGPHRPTDCCLSYTSRIIRCRNMVNYFVTSSGCSLPAVIFKTKRGKMVCVDLNNERVQDCMEKLNSAWRVGKRLVEEKLQ